MHVATLVSLSLSKSLILSLPPSPEAGTPVCVCVCVCVYKYERYFVQLFITRYILQLGKDRQRRLHLSSVV